MCVGNYMRHIIPEGVIMNCITNYTRVFSLGSMCTILLLVTACVTSKEYLKDWQSADAPNDVSDIIVLPEYPEAGRTFEIRRTYETNRRDRAKRKTPPEGYLEILKVVDEKGTLEFWRDGNFIHRVQLGKCFSFAKMDKHHNFAAGGAPAFSTAPPDCRVWPGRQWHQTYSSLVVGWNRPCVYEAKRVVDISTDTGGGRIVSSTSLIHMTMEKDGQTFDWKNLVRYDENLRFFKNFDIGYVGSVVVLREID